jgi:hypothetical protein
MMAKNRWRGLDQPPTELALMLGEAIFVRVQQHQIAALLQGQ